MNEVTMNRVAEVLGGCHGCRKVPAHIQKVVATNLDELYMPFPQWAKLTPKQQDDTIWDLAIDCECQLIRLGEPYRGWIDINRKVTEMLPGASDEFQEVVVAMVKVMWLYSHHGEEWAHLAPTNRQNVSRRLPSTSSVSF